MSRAISLVAPGGQSGGDRPRIHIGLGSTRVRPQIDTRPTPNRPHTNTQVDPRVGPNVPHIARSSVRRRARVRDCGSRALPPVAPPRRLRQRGNRKRGKAEDGPCHRGGPIAGTCAPSPSTSGTANGRHDRPRPPNDPRQDWGKARPTEGGVPNGGGCTAGGVRWSVAAWRPGQPQNPHLRTLPIMEQVGRSAKRRHTPLILQQAQQAANNVTSTSHRR